MANTWVDYFNRDLGFMDQLGHLCQHAPMFDAICHSGVRKVLEVGIGSGIMSAALAGIGALEVTGADIEEDLLDAARSKWLGMRGLSFVKADAFALREVFAPDQFDVAFSQGFFEHFSDEQVRDLVRQQLYVAPRVVFSVPSDQYGRQDFGDERLLSRSAWAEILSGTGAVCVNYYAPNREYLVPARGPFGGIGRNQYWHILAVIDREAEAL